MPDSNEKPILTDLSQSVRPRINPNLSFSQTESPTNNHSENSVSNVSKKDLVQPLPTNRSTTCFLKPQTLSWPAPQAWKQELQGATRSVKALCKQLDLPTRWADQAEAATKDFPLFAPPAFIRRMKPHDPHDPLLRQLLPLAEEMQSVPDFVADPCEDDEFKVEPGMLHKYQGRVLLIMTGACAIHCRYCFRRHYPYNTAPNSLAGWEPALKKIAADPSITEVLLSGGDPMMVGDKLLGSLITRLEMIPHLKRLRFHTRLPVMIPSRVTYAFVEQLASSRLRTFFVLHINHANEIDHEVDQACQRLSLAGVTLLNQAVLLRGINDTLLTQTTLCERLLEIGVLPYYLHQLDQVAGAAHFKVSKKKGLQLIAEMRKVLPGYGIPSYVQEIAGEPHKIILK